MSDASANSIAHHERENQLLDTHLNGSVSADSNSIVTVKSATHEEAQTLKLAPYPFCRSGRFLLVLFGVCSTICMFTIQPDCRGFLRPASPIHGKLLDRLVSCMSRPLSLGRYRLNQSALQ